MFDFAKFLGPVWWAVFLWGMIMVIFVISQIFPYSKPLGIVALYAGIFASIYLAGAVKLRVTKDREE